jgi:ATP-dependent DNA helicase RecQ
MRLARVEALRRWLRRAFGKQESNLWLEQLAAFVDDLANDTATGVVSAAQALEALHEPGHERRSAVRGRLTLSTVHGAKGREFRHVILLDGGWMSQPLEEERRLYYVGMTRARETLTLLEHIGRANPFSRLLEASASLHRSPRREFPRHDPALDRRIVQLGLRDVDLGYAGRAAKPRVREAIGELSAGSQLALRGEGEIVNGEKDVVGRIAKAFAMPEGEVEWVRASAIVHRSKRQMDEPRFRAMCRVEEWETVLCTVCFAPGGTAGTVRGATTKVTAT